MIRILQSQGEIDAARSALAGIGCDFTQGWRRRLFALRYTLRFRRPPEAIAVDKSWDVWSIATTIAATRPDRSARIYDMGSFNSEVPLALSAMGYRTIRAGDFNPLGRSIRWYGYPIDFHCEDFYHPAVPPHSFDVMTAVSVIEHGYDQAKLIAALDRNLAPGGLFLLTTDYHAAPVAIPEEFRIFDLSYRLFDRAALEDLVTAASRIGLTLLGDAEWRDSEYPIEFLGRRLTFAFLAFRKAG